MSWSVGKSPGPIGIDVGRHHVKAAQFNRSSGGWRIAAAASMPRTETGSDIQRADVRRLCDVLAKGKFKGRHIVLAVPSDKLLTTIMRLPPRTSGAPIEQIARSELARMHECDPETFEMACWDLPAPARAGESTYVMAAVCLHVEANALLDAFEAEGLHVQGLEIHASAAARACAPMLEGVSGIAAILDPGWSLERLVLLYQGVVVYERKRAKGGLHALVASLADHLKLKAQSVERLLMAGGLVSPQAGEGDDSQAAETIRAAAAAHFDTMVEEMRMPVSYVSNQYPDAAMDRMLLIGGGAEIPGLAEYLDSRLEFEVRNVRLADLTGCSRKLDEAHGPALTVAVGLGQYGQR